MYELYLNYLLYCYLESCILYPVSCILYLVSCISQPPYLIINKKTSK